MSIPPRYWYRAEDISKPVSGYTAPYRRACLVDPGSNPMDATRTALCGRKLRGGQRWIRSDKMVRCPECLRIHPPNSRW